jgi:hypothetical protein
MADCVIDATVVAMANGNIAARRPGNVFDRRLTVVEDVGRRVRRLRYNSKLRGEYERLVHEYRNDVIELFFTVLADHAVFVHHNSLSRQRHATARDKCGWPDHDQHLLAAALGGDDPTVFVTEDRHANCAACILARLRIHVSQLR